MPLCRVGIEYRNPGIQSGDKDNLQTMEEELGPQQFDVTPALFREWRAPRFSNENPQKLKL
jgi:hypothetical protein